MNRIRIAPNDPVLAHSMARSVMSRESVRDAQTWTTLCGLRGVKPLRRAITKRYGNRMLIEHVMRESGSRARAIWTVLDFSCEREHLWLADIEYDERTGRTALNWRGVGITEHCVARIIQRTVGSATVEAFQPLLLGHLTSALRAIRSSMAIPGERVLTFSLDGCIAWDLMQYTDGRSIIGKTWISAGLAVEPIIRAGIARCVMGGTFWTVG